MELLFDGIPLGEVSTSMTINAPASLLLLLYELVAEGKGMSADRLRGTVQNDILKEYAARGNYIFPPRPSMRLTTDLFASCEERLPNWNVISISGYHIREAGSTAVQEIAFTLANGLAYCRAAVEAGLWATSSAAALLLLQRSQPLLPGGGEVPGRAAAVGETPAERLGVTNPKALALRFHAQTGGSTLTAQQPENNIVRVAIQALSAVCGGAQSIHTNGFDEALALPTEHAARVALRTQQILQNEAGGTDTADPLGGAYFLEALTDELEARALELIDLVEEMGGAVAAIEAGFVQQEIEEAAYRYSSQVESGERVVVGVNRFADGDEERIELHRLDPEIERRQLARTSVSRGAGRRGGRGGLAEVRRVAGAAENLLLPMREALRRTARSARSARCSARSGAPSTRSVPSRLRPA